MSVAELQTGCTVRLLTVIVACSLLIAGGVQGQSAESVKDESAVRKLISAYVDAREHRDAKRLASILAPDADQLVSSGEWRKGRDDLVRGMLASSERNSGVRTIEVEGVRFIAPGVAIANGRYEIAGNDSAQPRRMWSTFILSRNNGTWRIHAIRNMLPSTSR
jgi:uncharacterized protein (TIGR02246 family)